MITWSATLRTATVALAVVIAGRAIVGGVRESSDAWLVVEHDSGYTIAIDTSRIVREYGRTYEIWYRTDHQSPRFYRGKAFTRETVHAILRCDGYAFRVISTAMSVGWRPSVISQAMGPADLKREAWHSLEPGSSDEKVALATCQVADWKTVARQ